jgi:hypothetical protein
MPPTSEPILAPPGTGLPAVELFIGRILFGLRRWTATRESVNCHFQKERAAIRALVNGEFSRIIRDLTQGRIPVGAVSTADVKPSPDVTPSVIADYEQACDALLAAVATAPELKTTLRFAHPWFGPLNAAGWHALASMHMGIHREQLSRILKALPAAHR